VNGVISPADGWIWWVENRTGTKRGPEAAFPFFALYLWYDKSKQEMGCASRLHISNGRDQISQKVWFFGKYPSEQGDMQRMP